MGALLALQVACYRDRPVAPPYPSGLVAFALSPARDLAALGTAGDTIAMYQHVVRVEGRIVMMAGDTLVVAPTAYRGRNGNFNPPRPGVVVKLMRDSTVHVVRREPSRLATAAFATAAGLAALLALLLLLNGPSATYVT